MSDKKRFAVRAECPYCGCGDISNLSEEEIRARTIHPGDLELTCPECKAAYKAPLEKACPAFSTACKV